MVSIIVRTKDRPKLLRRALQSIAAQTYRPIEVVLVNDGGCDLDAAEMETILGDISLNYIRLEKNTGRAHAGNVGIENAKGEYIGFLDDDDIYYPNAIESLKNAITINNGKIVYGKVICRNYEDFDSPNFTSEYTIGTPFDQGRLVFENFIPINSILIPRHFLNSAGHLDSSFEIYEDWDMMLRLSGIADFFFLDTIVAEYSIYGSATISGKGGADFQSHYRRGILEKHINKATATDFLAYIQSVIDRSVFEKDNQLSQELTNVHDTFRLKLAELGKKFSLKDAELQEVRESLKMREKELETLAAEWKRARDLLSEVLSTNSWRITKPLRVIGALSRRIFLHK